MSRTVVRALMLAALLTGCAKKQASEASVSAVAALEQELGVRIDVYDDGGTPPPRDTRVVRGPVDPAVIPRHLPTLRETLLRYPASARQELVGTILLVGKLQAGGTPFLGMAFPGQGRFELALRPRTRPEDLVGTIDHELAHVLYAGLSTARREAWGAFSAEHYVGRRPNEKWVTRGRPWLAHGFVTLYASKNPNEDFAELAEMAMTRPDRLRLLGDRYPLVARKVGLLTDAYRDRLPGMELPWVGEGWRRWQAEHADDRRRPEARPRREHPTRT